MGSNSFLKNVLILSSGTFSAQIVLVLLSPVILRVYPPEQIGMFANFTSVVLILGLVSTGRYEHAIILPKTRTKAISILVMVKVIMLLFFILYFVVFFLIGYTPFPVKNNFFSREVLLMIPFAIIFTGILTVFNHYQIREKNYKILSSNSLLYAIILSGMQIVFGYLGWGLDGLVISFLLSTIFMISVLFAIS